MRGKTGRGKAAVSALLVMAACTPVEMRDAPGKVCAVDPVQQYVGAAGGAGAI
jgi:hypothetical protein